MFNSNVEGTDKEQSGVSHSMVKKKSQVDLSIWKKKTNKKKPANIYS